MITISPKTTLSELNPLSGDEAQNIVGELRVILANFGIEVIKSNEVYLIISHRYVGRLDIFPHADYLLTPYGSQVTAYRMAFMYAIECGRELNPHAILKREVT